MRAIRALLLAILLLQPWLAAAADPPRRLSHYTHQRWTEGSEAPAPVLAMAQGRDGFLWLATGEGLFRFDGAGFERIEAADRNRAHGQPTAVLATVNGDIWTSFQGSRRFAIYRAGRLRLMDAPPAPRPIMAFAEGRDGAVWALTYAHVGELLRYRQGKWRTFTTADGLPHDDALGMLVADDGTLWIAFCNSLVRLAPGAERFETVLETPRANGRLSKDGAGRIWISEKRGSYPVTGPGGRGKPPPLRAPYRTDDQLIRGAPMFDRVGNLWIARRYGGVQRVAQPRPIGPSSPTGIDARVEAFRAPDGLSSDVTYQLLEDREGNIWVGTEKGIDKFRPATVRFEPALASPAAFGDKLTAASDGSVYIGQANAIYRVRPGGEPEAILRGVHEPQAICEAPGGAIWIAFTTHVLVWRERVIRTIGDRPVPRAIVYDCAFDARGDFWLSAAAGGLHRFRDGRWEAIYAPGRPNNLDRTTMVRDRRGRLVVQWDGAQLAWIDYPARTMTPLDFAGAAPEVLSLYATPQGDILAGGAFGLSRTRAGRVDTIPADPRASAGRINGIAQTPDGDVWLAYPSALVRISAGALDRAFAERRFPSPGLTLGRADGLASRPHSHSQRAIVRGGDGRLWIATETGTLWVDPGRVVRNPLAPAIAIKSLVSDGQLHRDPLSLQLAPAVSSIEIDYAALSFADPGAVQMRYMLEGYDHGWLDPGTRRQAFYTNLPPGKYRFRVVAANNEGVWNREGTSVEFDIPPTFFQSRWFLALCILLVAGLLWLVYRLRVAQVAGQVRNRLEERLAERERIARELHDTLLQGVQGLILRFQSIANRMAPHEPAREQLETALRRADDIIVEGRNRVRQLRVAETPADLRTLVQALVEEARFDPPVPVRILVEGKPRRVDPLVSAEIGRIAAEALFNIARHAKARSVDIVLCYGRRRLGLEIRDDGVGIAPDVLASGQKDGHFGLIGMRERAERIGGSFSIESRRGVGTQICLELPAKLAFTDQRTRRWRPFRALRTSMRSVPDA